MTTSTVVSRNAHLVSAFETSSVLNDLASHFSDPACRKQLMAQYGGTNTLFAGKNEANERVLIAIGTDRLVTQTFQSNGWIREVTYDAQGQFESESYVR